jgi:hypothetical protein
MLKDVKIPVEGKVSFVPGASPPACCCKRVIEKSLTAGVFDHSTSCPQLKSVHPYDKDEFGGGGGEKGSF